MTIVASRRGFLGGLGAALVMAPAIVRVSSIMPVKAFDPVTVDDIVALLDRRIDAAERVLRNDMMQSLYRDIAPAGDLFGTVMNTDLHQIGDRSGRPVYPEAPIYRLKSYSLGIPLNG